MEVGFSSRHGYEMNAAVPVKRSDSPPTVRSTNYMVNPEETQGNHLEDSLPERVIVNVWDSCFFTSEGLRTKTSITLQLQTRKRKLLSLCRVHES